MTNTHAIIRAFLEQHSTLTLATSNGEGHPEAAPLYYVSDEELNCYWLSAPHVRHSLNLSARPRVAAAIYPAVWAWTEIVGVQMEGYAEAISDPEACEVILARYKQKFPLPPQFDAAISSSTVYRLRPIWLRYIDNSIKFGHKVELRLDMTESS